MKEALNQLSLDIIKFHASDFACDIGSGTDKATAADQDLPPRPESTLQPDLESNWYQLLHLISDRLVPDHVSLIPFEHILAHPQKQDKTLDKTSVLPLNNQD